MCACPCLQVFSTLGKMPGGACGLGDVCVPIESEIIDGVAVFRPLADFSYEEAIAHTDRFYSEVPIKPAIWDFRGASLSHFPAAAFRDVAVNGARFVGARGEGAKIALLVGNDFDRMPMEAFSLH